MKEIIRNWMKQLCIEESPLENISALNFGIFESSNGYTLYLIGSCNYDADDGDWACNVDYTPKRKYLEIMIGKNMDSKTFLAEVTIIISNLLLESEIGKSLLFNHRIITIGFDDGDLYRIL